MKPAQSTKEISATRQSGSDISTDLHNKSLKNHFKNPDSPKDGERERKADHRERAESRKKKGCNSNARS